MLHFKTMDTLIMQFEAERLKSSSNTEKIWGLGVSFPLVVPSVETVINKNRIKSAVIHFFWFAAGKTNPKFLPTHSLSKLSVLKL